jgi:hypothetical protein
VQLRGSMFCIPHDSRCIFHDSRCIFHDSRCIFHDSRKATKSVRYKTSIRTTCFLIKYFLVFLYHLQFSLYAVFVLFITLCNTVVQCSVFLTTHDVFFTTHDVFFTTHDVFFTTHVKQQKVLDIKPHILNSLP